MTQPMEFLEQNGKARVPGDRYPDPSLSDSSPKIYNSTNDSNSSISKKKKRAKTKKRQKDKKDDSSDPSLSDNFDSSYDSDCRCKQRRRKSDRENDPIKLCARLTANYLTESYK